MIVATAGHIDHGKTLLVKTLTGVDTDRLPEEKARGISIDLGFAYWRPEQGGSIGFVDVPGHERFIHNMLAGVCGIDLALLTVAADDGVMPQTVEHLQILELLGIRKAIAAVTKIDRVDPGRAGEVEAQLRALLGGTALAGAEVLRVSAVTGEGIDALRRSLAAATRAHAQRYREGQHFRLAVDRAFSVAGSGTVVTGTVFNGEVRAGERLLLSPSGTAVRVRGLQIQGEAADSARAGERCAMNLSGVGVESVSRGDWVLSEALHAPARRIDVRLRLLASESDSLRHWTQVHLHLGTAEVMARVASPRAAPIAPGETARIQLVLDEPFSSLNGDRFIVRDRSASRTLGGGTVIDPLAKALGRASAERAATLAALEKDSPEAALGALLEIPAHALDVAHFERIFNLTPQRMEALLQGAGAVVLGRERRVAITRAGATALGEGVLARLAAFHRSQPRATGIGVEQLRAEFAPHLGADSFLTLLRELADAGRLVINGATALLPGHDTTSNTEDERTWGAVLPALLQGGLSPAPVAELAAALGLKEPVLRDFLHRKSRTGEVMRVTEDRFYPKATLATLAATAAAVARSSSNGLFTAAQYRDATGIGRTLGIKILEFFDTLGITQRIGDARRMRKDFVPLLGPGKPARPGAPRPQGQAAQGARPQPGKPRPARRR